MFFRPHGVTYLFQICNTPRNRQSFCLGTCPASSRMRCRRATRAQPTSSGARTSVEAGKMLPNPLPTPPTARLQRKFTPQTRLPISSENRHCPTHALKKNPLGNFSCPDIHIHSEGQGEGEDPTSVHSRNSPRQRTSTSWLCRPGN